MANLFIHTGIHKTGSTSFQIFLKRNKDVLESNHVYRLPILEDAGPTAHVFANAFIKSDDKKIESYGEALANFLKRSKPSKGDVFVISSEEFDRLDADATRKLSAFFAPFFQNIKVGIYIRPHAALIDSQHSQQVREGFLKSRSDVFFRACVKHARFVRLSQIANDWVDGFGSDNVVIRSAQREDLYKSDIVSDILKFFLNLEADKRFTRSPNVNNKLSNFSREALIHILHDPRMSALDFHQRRKILIRYFRNAPPTDLIVKPGDSAISYSILVASQFLFRDDYNEMNDKFFDGALNYPLWYQKQVHAFDVYARSIANVDTLDEGDLKLSQKQFWAFFDKAYSA